MPLGSYERQAIILYEDYRCRKSALNELILPAFAFQSVKIFPQSSPLFHETYDLLRVKLYENFLDLNVL